MPIFCKNCKKENINNNFCIYCGTKLMQDNIISYENIINTYDGVYIGLLAKVAKSEGVISKKQASYISNKFDTLSKNRTNLINIREVYKKILNIEKDSPDNIKEFCDKFLKLNRSHQDKVDILSSLIELAHLDKFSKSIENIVLKITYALELNLFEYEKITKNYQKEDNSKNYSEKKSAYLTISNSYLILEAKEDNSNIEIKTKYRKMLQQYHTDILVSKNLPTELLIFAEEKVKEINNAYEMIKNYRGIR